VAREGRSSDRMPPGTSPGGFSWLARCGDPVTNDANAVQSSLNDLSDIEQ
jgi:hypothetical protein